MSALPDNAVQYRRMMTADLPAVVAIEQGVYTHPWTLGNFADSLQAGYHCWIIEAGSVVVGYSVTLIAAGEAHLLNLSIAADRQRQGLGRDHMAFLIKLARDHGAEKMYLEVRPSNDAGRALYRTLNFVEVGLRRDYYPAHGGREDAILMETRL